MTGQTAFTVSVQIPNATTSGTVLNQLACWNGSAGQSAAMNCTAMSTTNFIGVVIGNPGTSGNAVVVESGPTPCLFDSTTPTANDYVVASTTSGMGGRCSDAGTKCGTGQVDHDIGKVGLEIDIEDRSPTPRGSPSDIGLYLAMLNSINSQNYAIVIGANTAAGVTSVPWGTGLFISGTGGTPQTPGTLTGIEVGPGGASTAVKIDELATTGPSNSQPLSLCAYKGASPSSEVCTNLSTSSSQDFVIASPGATQISSTYGLQAVHYAGVPTVPTVVKGSAVVSSTATVSIVGTDFSGTVSVSTTTITPGVIATVTFANSYNVSVNCLVSQNGGGTMSQVGVSHSQSLPTLIIGASVAGASSTYAFDYFCSGS